MDTMRKCCKDELPKGCIGCQKEDVFGDTCHAYQAYKDGFRNCIKEMKQFMLETFGGDDGTGNLNKIYEHLDGLEEKINEK